MKTFACVCGARIFFRNTRCLACQRELAFLADRRVMSALEPDQGAFLANGARYLKCQNYEIEGVCNWTLPAGASQELLCSSCRLNRVTPDPSVPEQRALWARVEGAKRHLLYTLLGLGLPIRSKTDDPEKGLAFDFKTPTPAAPVLTGHAAGVITLNLDEADPVAREEMRIKMRERYRTLLGHFRHEIGHYYFMLLIDGGALVGRFRELFGDERQDYTGALKRHYESVPRADWSDEFITPYAAAHPWEDWAETWAHYLHMLDTLETAQDFGLISDSPRASPVVKPNPEPSPFDTLLGEWMSLTVALNALNRSMGLQDPYPFQIAEKPARKLGFIHELVSSPRSGEAQPVGAAARSC